MKRLFAALLALTLGITCLASCGTPPAATTPEATTPEATTPEATTPEVTTPEVTTPEVTTPNETTPSPEPPVDEAFLNRWNNVDLPADVLAAMQDLYTIYDERIPAFLASLYDPSVGAFYFSGSARDYEGFAPDIESTTQILDFLYMSGMAKKEDLKTKLPAEVVASLIAFTQAMQDPDGYFYHTQWQKNINDTRRGRDLSWAVSLLNTLGAKPLYETATEKLEGGVTASIHISNRAFFAPLTTLRPLGLPTYLTSEALFIDYLDNLTNGKLQTSYGWANTLNAITDQIIAAGLGQVAVNYFNEKMSPETGLWSSTVVDYNTVSAIMKMGNLYKKTGNSFPYPEKTLASCITVAKGEASPNVIVFIYNPWSAISSLRSTLPTSGTYTKAMLDETLLASAADMLTASKAKLRLFQKEDGTFSYYQDASMTTSQGVSVGLGINEGDVNSTKIALASTLSSIWGALGESMVAVYPTSALDSFNAALLEATAPEKKPQPVFDGTFEEGTTKDWSIQSGNGNTIEIIDDPTATDANKVIRLHKTTTGTNDNFQANLRKNTYLPGDKIIFTFDFYLASIDIKHNPGESTDKAISSLNHTLYQIDYSVGTTRFYMLTVNAKKGDFTTYTFGDASSTGGDALKTDFEKEFKVGVWYTITLELTLGDENIFAARILVDGEEIGTSNNYYGKEASKPITDFKVTALRFRSQQRAVVDTYFDNVTVTYPRANDDGE